MFNNFTLQNPVKVIFGKGSIAQLPKNIPANAKVMLTYGGGSIFSNGVHEQVINALTGYDVIEFGGIEANPTFETLMAAVEVARKEHVTFLLAVGGGSVLDGTKFMSVAIPFEGGDEWNNIVKRKAKYGEALPIGAVMTLPATGSEMNSIAVISKKETDEKFGMGHPLLYPQFSILDPETTYSLPKRQVANGVADAFTHVMEQYLTYPVGAEIQDRFAEGILQTLISVGQKTIANPEDYEARANLFWAATVALNGWISVGVPQDWATHQIGHELTALHGIDHARSLAIILPHLMRYKLEDKKEKMIQYALRVWELSGTDEELVEGAIQRTIDFYESLGIPTSGKAYGIGDATINEIVKRFEERGSAFGEHGDIDAKAASDILKMSIAE
ncbi:iron-containing alcohol dehydrogenase [Arcticibacterium luteifluviistationis]|uniref:NADH-dependent alcohol dehydrogenase n=1 Tax=Arcticibacterium luteifluviistationis TaxID=1784714 RepID=A0A2Z4GAF8_9BACT|nr:iron-containing alcohol dehydrogenase [Arcticibacterium luteifluviistationis]AWV98242.1 NADH-dependent alcohol dehydrogenase [Arcticibacterium luteifluviistationis]